MQSTADKILRWSVVLGVFAIPFVALVVVPAMYFPTDAPKGFAFRIIAETVAGAWIALAMLSKEYRPSKSLLLGTLLFFVSIMAIADVHGVNPYRSLWGNYEHMDGLVTLVCLFMFALVASSVLTSESVWRAWFHCSLAVSVAVGIYGFLEESGLTPLSLGARSFLQSPIIGTFGNPLELSAYMLINIFIAALLWVMTKPTDTPPTLGRSLLPWLYGIAIAFDTTILFLTGIRGGVVGLMAGVVATLLLLAVVNKSQTLRYVAIAACMLMVILGISLKAAQHTELVQNIRSLSHLSGISLNDPTIASRLMAYGIALNAFQERPMLGWGQENFIVAFCKYYDPRLEMPGWADRVHNLMLQILVDGGVAGLISFIAIIAAVAWTIWNSGAFSTIERCLLSGLFVAYLVQDMFEFDSVVSSMLLWMVLAYLVFRSCSQVKQQTIQTNAVAPLRALLVVPLLLATIVVVWRSNADALFANIAFRQAMLVEQRAPPQGLQDYEQALFHQSFGSQEIREQLAQDAISIVSLGVDSDIKQQFFTLAKSQMQTELANAPLNAPGNFYLGVMCNNYGDYACANAALQAAHDLAPKKQAILIASAANAAAQNDASSALAYAKEAFDLYPDFTEARINYAKSRHIIGK